MKPFDQSGNIEEMLRKASEGETILMVVLSVKDLARNRFSGPRVMGTVREGIRDFKYIVEKDPLIAADPQDYELYQIGMFNPVTAETSNVTPVRISRGLDFIKS